MKLEIGTRVRWESAAGVLRGTITNITLSPSASGAVTPWIDIKVASKRNSHSVRLCALDSNLKAMRVSEVGVEATPATYVERTNIMTGKKFMEREDTPFFCSPSSETFWSM
ncbi:hypothetical protein UFOVP190_293 [uncultured Caudovirales phage]|jgi:hypothetical protein|uniref:Uncharacterized protein n=1 Tax=uncultured Caudovirales phage TaxID=2100421 RepID=A0A6J7WPG2_9CAUD|nr:hypothetical protein UFOVP190_293 [uncultured Caudovirales phage]